MKQMIFSFVFVLLGMTSTNAQLKGDWKGTLSVQGVSLELIFHISEVESGYEATTDVPMQGLLEFLFPKYCSSRIS